MQILADQPSSIAKILDTSFKLFSASFTKIVGYGLIIAALCIVSSIVVAGVLGDLPVGGPEAAAVQMMRVMPVMMACFFVVTLLSMIPYAAIIRRIDEIAQGREGNFGEALQFGLNKLPAFFLGLLIYAIAVGIGSMLLLVPGVILMLSLSFYPFFIVLESQGGFEALKNSHDLVWGNWWRTLTVYMAPGILLIVLFTIIDFISAAFGETDRPGSVGATDIIGDLLYAVIMPYFYTLAYVLYHDLKLRKSGGDLAARLAR